jgi:hypothetical protein
MQSRCKQHSSLRWMQDRRFAKPWVCVCSLMHCCLDAHAPAGSAATSTMAVHKPTRLPLPCVQDPLCAHILRTKRAHGHRMFRLPHVQRYAGAHELDICSDMPDDPHYCFREDGELMCSPCGHKEEPCCPLMITESGSACSPYN